MKYLPKTWYEPSGAKSHLVSVIQDGTRSIAVSKAWSRRRQSWCYEARPVSLVKDFIRFREQFLKEQAK